MSAREVAKRALELGDGHVNTLINNAGIYPFGPTHEMTEEQFDRVFSVNVKAPYLLVAKLAPLMAKRGNLVSACVQKPALFDARRQSHLAQAASRVWGALSADPIELLL